MKRIFYCILTSVYIICGFILFITKENSIILKKENNRIINKTYNHYKTEFMIFYDQQKKKLDENIIKTKECIKENKKNMNNRSDCNIYRITLPSYKNIPYREIYRKYKGGYDAVIEPKYERDVEVIVGIPCAPPLVDGRIVARRTYMQYKYIDGLKAKYIFITGLIPTKIYNYNFSWLKEESDTFDDIIVFDVINTYWNITLLMLSMHKWLIRKYSHIKYFIRCNLDAIFIPFKTNGILNQNYDVMSQIARYVMWKIIYPQGCFYIFSFKIVKLIYEQSFRRSLHRMDDVFYGQIITHDKSINILDLFKTNQMESGCDFCPMLYNNTFVALHPYSPSFIEIIYNYSQIKLYNII